MPGRGSRTTVLVTRRLTLSSAHGLGVTRIRSSRIDLRVWFDVTTRLCGRPGVAFVLLCSLAVKAHPFRLRRHLGREGGFTLVEILIACAIIGVGLVAVS